MCPLLQIKFLLIQTSLGLLCVFHLLRNRLSLRQCWSLARVPYELGIAVWTVYCLQQIDRLCYDDPW